MSYLGIDITRALELADSLRSGASRVEPIQRLLVQAESLAEWPVQVTLALDEIRADYQLSADQIGAAVISIESFRLQLADLSSRRFDAQPSPSRTPVPIDQLVERTPELAAASPPLWNAEPNMAWNLVQQDASHNSYAVDGGIAALYQHGVRTFELDIHRDRATRLGPLATPWRWADRLFASPPLDWRVYHINRLGHSEYESFSDGLAAVAALDTSDPLTIFVDNKDQFGDAHTARQFDLVLDRQLGERLYAPAELLSRAPQARTLSEAVQLAGWPTVAELNGRIMVVVTDNLDGYNSMSSRAFIAPAPVLQGSTDDIIHMSDPDVVFYNANGHRVDSADIEAVQSGNSVIRTYFNPRCASATIEPSLTAPNYRAVDVEPGDLGCSSPVPAPPEGVPVPTERLGDLEQPLRGVEVDQRS